REVHVAIEIDGAREIARLEIERDSGEVLNVGEGEVSIDAERGPRVLEIFERAIDDDVRGGGGDARVFESGAFGLERDGGIDGEDNGRVAAGDYVDGLQRDAAGVGLLQEIELQQCVEIVAFDIDGLRRGVEGEETVADEEAIDGEVDESIEHGGVGFGMSFWFGDVGGAIGEDHDVRVRLLDAEVCDIEHAAETGEEAQVDADTSDVDPRLGVLRLIAVDDEFVDDGFELPGVKCEGADLDAAAGAILCTGD